ncbi:MAG: energy transducer TonB [Terriglobales bacterium]
MADQRPESPDPIFHLDESSPLKEFYERFREVFRPEKKPELVLESKPIPVKDIWAPRKPLSSRLVSLGIHAAIIGVALLPFWRPVRKQIEKAMNIQEIFEPAPLAQVQLPKMRRLSGGGIRQITPPQVVQTPDPHPMAVTPTLLAPVLTTENLPTFGAMGPIAGPPGVGGGQNGGPGGMGTGPGSPNGNCVSGPDCVDAGEVASSGPVVLYKPNPEYTDAARKARFQGTCVVEIVIDKDGHVSNPKVLQALGLGLDQKAIEAVLRWRFQPARDRNGRPIAVVATVDINFRLF